MKQLLDIAREESSMDTVVNLTSVFESLASMRIFQIKSQVLSSQNFFRELWHIYTQIRVDGMFRFGRENEVEIIDKELIIAVTSESGFSGDIDQKLIQWMIEYYKADLHDIIIIGHHGALQLSQAGVSFKKYFKLPTRDDNINVAPLINQIKQYRNTVVFYQTYVSLMVQDIKKIELQSAVKEAGKQSLKDEELISELTYIFEPTAYAVAAHLERSMLEISLTQTILDSKLAQYASRFRSMSAAKERSLESQSELKLQYNRTKRALADDRLKEIINGMKQVHLS